MAEIKLSQGKVAIVDDADFEWLSRWKWCYSDPNGAGRGYASRSYAVDGRTKTVRMHRAILDAAPGVLVDHVNRDTLDNRRANLRLCSTEENNRNTKLPCTNTSGFRGVTRNGRNGRWRAQIQVGGKCLSLGEYDAAEEAARAYDAAAMQQHGAFASLNFPSALGRDWIFVSQLNGAWPPPPGREVRP